ncbi:Mechanosensitive ion channel-domain-containing protein [Abortiporus biennis]|nr:Mechanosensitive ion channel-domain-containing protein [Abortiporus biennis]
MPAPYSIEEDRGDSMSLHSNSPLQTPITTPTYPPLPSQSQPFLRESLERKGRLVRMPDDDLQQQHNPSFGNYDTAETGGMMPMPMSQAGSRPTHHMHTSSSRNGSWDLLAGIRKFEHSYEEFDSRNASQSHLAFAEGDLPKNKFARFYNYLLNVSIITRWFLFIIPVLALLWIPGIVGFTTFPNAAIWGVHLIWWSIWFSVLWVGWWVALAGSMILPHIARNTVGVVAVGTRRYIDWLDVLHRYVALFGWTLGIWISFQPLINTRREPNISEGSASILTTIAKLLFAFFLCAALLAFEKFSIQWIAGKFHERSYAERITAQKFAVNVLVTLYRHSSDIPGRSDTLKDGPMNKRASVDPKKFFKAALRGVRSAATTTTTALGNVASEIAGSSILQPNSPQAMVKTALESANKSRLLARRLYYSFARPGAEFLIVEDIARFFPTPDDADAAFAIFDKDSNGDASRDEIEMACMDFHREQLSIEHSMRDLDSAVGRLDNILMSVYFIVAILIVAVALEAQLVTLITGAGTLILGLSWLIGGSLSEVLDSIIFLFIKHPYDVGDRVTVDDQTYTVKEIRLLSTIFLDGNSCSVQAPHTVLNDKFLLNIRRSPQMSEPFTFDVAYSTTFEQIEKLRELMIGFLKSERRDYQAIFDVTVVDIPEQEKMTLRVDIKYKSNWQQGALKAKRRNKWICALKSTLAQVKIFGPSGDPHAKAAPARYTLVPWEQVQHEDQSPTTSSFPGGLREPILPQTYTFSDQNAVIMDDTNDVFGEADELHLTNPRRGPSAPSSLRQRSSPAPSMPSAVPMPSGPAQIQAEEIELRTPRAVTFAPV